MKKFFEHKVHARRRRRKPHENAFGGLRAKKTRPKADLPSTKGKATRKRFWWF